MSFLYLDRALHQCELATPSIEFPCGGARMANRETDRQWLAGVRATPLNNAELVRVETAEMPSARSIVRIAADNSGPRERRSRRKSNIRRVLVARAADMIEAGLADVLGGRGCEEREHL